MDMDEVHERIKKEMNDNFKTGKYTMSMLAGVGLLAIRIEGGKISEEAFLKVLACCEKQ